jgi:hypothetical protein
MQAGVLLVANGWGTSPNSTDIRITLPQTDSTKQITPQMSMEEAQQLYADSLKRAEQELLEGPGPVIDVEANKEGDESWGT